MFKKIMLVIFGCSLLIYSFFQFKSSFIKIENPGYIKFISANKLLEENKNKEALKEYIEAMDMNEDINIKKNYEIAMKKSEENENNEDKNNKDENDKDKDKENQKNESKNESEQNSDKEQNEEQQKEEELKNIMQRLESNEKKAFKNNEKILNNSENKDSENRW